MTANPDPARPEAALICIDDEFVSRARSYLRRIADGEDFTESDRWGARGLKDRLYAEQQHQQSTPATGDGTAEAREVIIGALTKQDDEDALYGPSLRVTKADAIRSALAAAGFTITREGG